MDEKEKLNLTPQKTEGSTERELAEDIVRQIKGHVEDLMMYNSDITLDLDELKYRALLRIEGSDDRVLTPFEIEKIKSIIEKLYNSRT